MAASDPLDRQPAATQGAVAGDRFRGILGAARGEPAVAAEERAEQELVGPDQELKQLRHVWNTGAVRVVARVKTCRQPQVRI